MKRKTTGGSTDVADTDSNVCSIIEERDNIDEVGNSKQLESRSSGKIRAENVMSEMKNSV